MCDGLRSAMCGVCVCSAVCGVLWDTSRRMLVIRDAVHLISLTVGARGDAAAAAAEAEDAADEDAADEDDGVAGVDSERVACARH
jgi:hypothetical protein